MEIMFPNFAPMRMRKLKVVERKSERKGNMNIGAEIKRVLEDKGITPEFLAKQINTSRRNVYDILTRREVSTGQLEAISKALDYDFFQLFGSMVNEPGAAAYATQKQVKKVAITIELDGRQTTLDDLIDTLKKVNSAIVTA